MKEPARKKVIFRVRLHREETRCETLVALRVLMSIPLGVVSYTQGQVVICLRDLVEQHMNLCGPSNPEHTVQDLLAHKVLYVNLPAECCVDLQGKRLKDPRVSILHVA